MISHARKFLFVHVPKTGGTSIESLLSPYGTVLQGPENFGSIYYKHATAPDLERMLGPSEYRSYFRFTFVRDPWDWIVSQYSFNRGLSPPFVFRSRHELSGRVRREHRRWSFEEWLPWWIEELSPSQSEMLVCNGRSLEFDFVGRFESFARDVRSVCQHLDVPVGEIPHLKPSKHRPSYTYYSEHSRRLVREHFASDFERLGYPTG